MKFIEIKSIINDKLAFNFYSTGIKMKIFLNIILLSSGFFFVSGQVNANQADPVQDILMCKYVKSDDGIDVLMEDAAKNTNEYEDDYYKNYKRLGQAFKSAVLVRELSGTEEDSLSYIGKFKKPHNVVSQFYNINYSEGDGEQLRVQTKLNYDNLQLLIESTNNIKLKDYTSLIKKNFIGIHVNPITGAEHYPTRVSGFMGKHKGKEYGIFVYEYKNIAYAACGGGIGANMINQNANWQPDYRGENIKN